MQEAWQKFWRKLLTGKTTKTSEVIGFFFQIYSLLWLLNEKKIISLLPSINSGLIKFLTMFLNISDIFNLLSSEKYTARKVTQNSDDHKIFMMDKFISHVSLGCSWVMPLNVSETNASDQFSAYIALCWEAKHAADGCQTFWGDF